MQLYRFSPILDQKHLLEAMHYIHGACLALCEQVFGKYLPNSGNMGIFCHYEDEYITLHTIREKMTESSDNPDQKYFLLKSPFVIPGKDNAPATSYTHLYIRKPDPYRHHVGDLDFSLDSTEYFKLKKEIENGNGPRGARIFPRTDLNMIELFDPDSDVLAYVSTHRMTQKVRVKQSETTNL